MRFTPLKPGKGLKRSSKRMKARHRAIGNPTRAEQVHQDLQRAHGCALCLLLGVVSGTMVRVHHRTVGDLHGQKQLGQDCTCGLCDWHHQGIPAEGMQAEAMRQAYGPSLQLNKRSFLDLLLELLGQRSTQALQRWQDAQLADVDTWPGSHA